MQRTGKILWWDQRDKNGIISDAEGTKYYFDVSTVDSKFQNKIKSGQIVRFEINSRIKEKLCALKVALANNKEQNKHEKEVENKKQLSLF